MKKFLISMFIAASLLGCAHTEKQVVVKQEYIVRIPPADLMTVPAPVPDINLDDPALKQSDIARWIAMIIERMDDIERRLQGVAKFLKEEQDKVDGK